VFDESVGKTSVGTPNLHNMTYRTPTFSHKLNSFKTKIIKKKKIMHQKV
jgi:hypothetical protein